MVYVCEVSSFDTMLTPVSAHLYPDIATLNGHGPSERLR